MSVLGEPLVLLGNLEGELPGVAHDQDGDLAVDHLDLLERGQHEDGSLAHAGLGLAQDVHAQDSLGDALVLDWGREKKLRNMRKHYIVAFWPLQTFFLVFTPR